MINKTAERITGIRDSVIESEAIAMEEFVSYTEKSKPARKPYKDKTVAEIVEEGLRATKNWDEDWEDFMNNETAKSGGRSRMRRHKRNLMLGCAVRPKGKECYAWGKTIIETTNHVSMKNSEYLIDDEEFLLQAAAIAPSPKKCTNYFYNYIHHCLKKNKKFRLSFLKNIYMNNNFIPADEIDWFVENYGFEKEQQQILSDLEFKKELKEHLCKIKHDMLGEYIEVKASLKSCRRINSYKKLQEDMEKLLATFKTEEELMQDEFDGLF